MKFELTILGSSSAIPTKDRFPTAQLLNFYDRFYLIDCGEGTQIQLRKYRFSMQKIGHIFISHVHADHFLGLPGLLSTMDLLGRKTPLEIYCPEAIKTFMDAYEAITHNPLSFEVNYHFTDAKATAVIFENETLRVEAFPLKHSVPCTGFLFTEKPRKKNIRKEALSRYFLTVEDMKRIKDGGDYTTPNGTVVPNRELTTGVKPSRSYAFVTDTAYRPEILPVINGVSLLYHEATFTEAFKKRAKATCHSTAAQAATIARDAGAKKLLIGHFSVRYDDLTELHHEATAIFPGTVLAEEGMRIEIGND